MAGGPPNPALHRTGYAITVLGVQRLPPREPAAPQLQRPAVGRRPALDSDPARLDTRRRAGRSHPRTSRAQGSFRCRWHRDGTPRPAAAPGVQPRPRRRPGHLSTWPGLLRFFPPPLGGRVGVGGMRLGHGNKPLPPTPTASLPPVAPPQLLPFPPSLRSCPPRGEGEIPTNRVRLLRPQESVAGPLLSGRQSARRRRRYS